MAWVLDLDGVLWLAGTALPGSPEAVARLRSAGQQVLFITNNSGPRLEDHIAALAAIGVTAGPDDIGSSAHAAAGLLEPGSTAYVLGGPGVLEAVRLRGVEIVGAGVRPDARAPGRGRHPSPRAHHPQGQERPPRAAAGHRRQPVARVGSVARLRADRPPPAIGPAGGHGDR